MKIAALLLLVVGAFLIVGTALLYFFGFIMSFDAPGSDKDPKAWGMRFLLFSPVLLGVILWIVAFLSFYAGQYKKAMLIGGVFPVLAIIGFAWLSISSAASYKKYKTSVAQDEADAKLYPVQNFLRQGALGTDTIIVWPSRIVAYRLHVPEFENTWNGPLGDLNESRDVMKFNHSTDTRLKQEELSEFTDESGRRFTEVYKIE